MFVSRATVVAALLGVSAANKMEYPVMEPAYDVWGIMDKHLTEHMSITNYTWELLGAGWVPETCFNGFFLDDLEGRDFDVYSVTFDDCSEPFVVCRHKDSKASPESIFDSLGRLTGRMRQWAGNFVAIPTVKEEYAAWQTGPTIVVQDTYWDSPGLMIHEMAHAMDLLKLGSGSMGGGQYWTDQAIWRDRLDEDDHVVSPYALTNYIEAFAETARVKAYDLIVPGGLAKLPQDSAKVSKQLNMLNAIWSEFILPQCSGRVASSDMVRVPVSRRRRDLTARSYPKPDVTIHKVPVMHPPHDMYLLEPHAEEAFESWA